VTDRYDTMAASAMIDAERDTWVYWLDALARLLSPVFAQARSRRAGFDYARALLRVHERRSCWQLAEMARHLSPRRLQALLGEYQWKAETLVERVRELVVAPTKQARAEINWHMSIAFTHRRQPTSQSRTVVPGWEDPVLTGVTA
jgi:hypothetical protein